MLDKWGRHLACIVLALSFTACANSSNKTTSNSSATSSGSFGFWHYHKGTNGNFAVGTTEKLNVRMLILCPHNPKGGINVYLEDVSVNPVPFVNGTSRVTLGFLHVDTNLEPTAFHAIGINPDGGDRLFAVLFHPANETNLDTLQATHRALFPSFTRILEKPGTLVISVLGIDPRTGKVSSKGADYVLSLKGSAEVLEQAEANCLLNSEG